MPGVEHLAISCQVLNTQQLTMQELNTQSLNTQVLDNHLLNMLRSRKLEVRRGFDLAPHEAGRPCELASQNGDAVPQAC